jgi:hypothetical protein
MSSILRCCFVQRKARSLPVALVISERPTTTEPSAETADAALTATK